MDTRARIDLLSAAAGDEAADSFAPEGEQKRADLMPCLSHVQAPGGRRVAVLKVLQTNACRNNCHYCALRAGRDVRREHLTPDEMARSVDLMHRAGIVEGVFLSSGVTDTVKNMDELLATAELLRGRYEFHGYLHLKLLPGCGPDQAARAVELADRVSTNLEAPRSDRLAFLAPQKQMADLVGPLQAAARVLERRRLEIGDWRLHKPSTYQSTNLAISNLRSPVSYPGGGWLGLSTQFVVGPAGESDQELLSTAAWLYKEVRLARAYYSPFRPIEGTPLEEEAPTDGRRQHRLYQADWLLRYYGFGIDELPFEAGGALSTTTDPKLAWAQRHPERFPIEVNRAPMAELLRIPGIGPASARAILGARRLAAIRTLGDLRRLGARAERAAPYVLLAGVRPPYQMPLPMQQPCGVRASK